MRQDLGEVKTELAFLRRDVAGAVASTRTELEAESEAGEDILRVVIYDLVAVGDGVCNELHIYLNQATDLQSDLKRIWLKDIDACAVLK